MTALRPDELMAVPAARLEPVDITSEKTQVVITEAETPAPPVASGPVREADAPEPTTIQSVDRALGLIELLAEADEPMKLQEIAEATGLKSSTCHHLLNTLARRGFVVRTSRPRAYALGTRINELASARGARFDLVQVATPHLDALAATTGATVCLAALSGTDLMVLRRVMAEGGAAHAGSIAHAAHATALGKAIVAWLPEPQIARVVAEKGLTAFTNKTIDNLGELVESLRQVRRHGFALEDEEFEDGLMSIACAIRNRAGAVVGAVGALLPKAEAGNPRLRALHRDVAACATRISAACP